MSDQPTNQLYQLARPFKPGQVKAPPKGKFGSYVSHSTVTERALSIVGAHSFEIVEPVRGWVPSWASKESGRSLPERNDAIVGVIARLTAWVDGREVSITEAGTADNPDTELDGENLKKAASDAYKRCWMRLGLGLHLWSGKDYFLLAQLAKGLDIEVTKEEEEAIAPDGESPAIDEGGYV